MSVPLRRESVPTFAATAGPAEQQPWQWQQPVPLILPGFVATPAAKPSPCLVAGTPHSRTARDTRQIHRPSLAAIFDLVGMTVCALPHHCHRVTGKRCVLPRRLAACTTPSDGNKSLPALLFTVCHLLPGLSGNTTNARAVPPGSSLLSWIIDR